VSSVQAWIKSGATGGTGALAFRQGTFAPVGELWYFFAGMALAIGHMAMFHINRESDV